MSSIWTVVNVRRKIIGQFAACLKQSTEASSYDYLIEPISKDGIDDATEALVVIELITKT